MPLIKMATAARRARLGSTKAIRRVLAEAGVPLVTLSPGEFAVEEADLNRFLEQRPDLSAAPRAKARPQLSEPDHPAEASGGKSRVRKRRQ